MTNFQLNFDHPWLLLLLAPALAMTLIPYFRMNKKYRRTRNRIVSMILHMVIVTLLVLVFAGFDITYDIPNVENEVLLVVDTSFSGKENEADRNAFVEAVINSTESQFKVGVVTFGYDQVYAVELTDQTDGVYEKYLQAPKPNKTLAASDIASALTYASTLFHHPESARIVLLSDGAETDNKASQVIRSIAASGIKVDTVHFPNEETSNEVQLLGVTTPSSSIRVGETFSLTLTLQSQFEEVQKIVVQMYDNEEESTSKVIELENGVQTVNLDVTFNVPDMHKLSFEITDAGEDGSELNNNLNSYIYLEVFDKVLIIENGAGEGTQIGEMLSETMQVNRISVTDQSTMPQTLDDLRAYDEVILCNIANSDMPEGFAEILHSYVYDIGGGLFTVGGHAAESAEGNWQANAYTRDDMYNTLYQKMLPVEIINYTPPIAVMILVDASGSMWSQQSGQAYEQSKLYAAKQGAEACLEELSDRDYVGIMSLSDYYTEQVGLTPRPQRSKILAAIDSISLQGGTIFEGALEGARQALLANTKVEKRHIILVTDGIPGDASAELYLKQARLNAEAGITMSVVGVECDGATQKAMIELVEQAGGTADNFYDVKDVVNVATQMREDLKAPEIKDVNYETYIPKISSTTSVVNNIRQTDMPELDGFFGSKLKEGASEILSAEYVPVYAQWEYGKGMVGSFMCDLNGKWSSNFVNTEVAGTLVNNIVTALFPSENIRPSDIRVELYEDNYHNILSVITPMEDGQSICVTVTSPAADGVSAPTVNVYTPAEHTGQTRVPFQVLTPGQHKILVEKLNADGSVASAHTLYKCFSYSREYDAFMDPQACVELMAGLAEGGEGVVIDKNNPYAVFENVKQFLHRQIDPQLPFLIIALVLFLTDLAVRKFKFKWIHELIREQKLRKSRR